MSNVIKEINPFTALIVLLLINRMDNTMLFRPINSFTFS